MFFFLRKKNCWVWFSSKKRELELTNPFLTSLRFTWLRTRVELDPPRDGYTFSREGPMSSRQVSQPR